ncbi:sugar metabolism global transcriptional regulator Mlc [Biostraticola tofi]|uniref:Transcriptional regulator of PTS protein n=1 Tax=Biostraticola tofi TaxID=466109 RepID=A0A4R3Z1Z5_9GAMM|nr:ROK family protein [Biostraticola tofi]TCV99793.1 transcriptional regulator of PTS gene [Biostraticola tofi]
MIGIGQPGHIDQIRQANIGSVYRLIDSYGPISRIALSKEARLAPASITKIARELLDAHLVMETEYQENGLRGRPAIGLITDTRAWHFLAVRISHGTLTLALRDLSSALVVEETLTLPVLAAESLMERLIAHIDQFFIRHQQQLERLTSVAVTLPGIIDAGAGIVHRMPWYDVHDLMLAEHLGNHIGVPVYVQHDICAWTMAEALSGAARGCSDVIQIVIDHNVGAGVITGGRLLHGASRSLVEIGHTQIDPGGKLCYCGNRGCLETVASIESIFEQVRDKRLLNDDSSLNRVELDTDTLCAAAMTGDALAQSVIEDVGNSIGRVLAVMVNLFNPKKILVGSPLNQASDILFPIITASIRRQSLPDYSKNIMVESTFFQNHGTMPAAALVKNALYDGSLLLKLLQG